MSDFSNFRQTRCARKIPKPVLGPTLITKETTYTLDFRKYFVVSFSVKKGIFVHLEGLSQKLDMLGKN
jgi:hypothetical protein